MRTISKAFIREQQKNRSKGISWKLKASAENETKDLTTYLCRESLSRIEWRLENDLTSFVNSDFQCSLWYDEELWDWLNIHDKILVEILCGFDFEKIQVFWGYIDKDYLKKDSLGLIYIRICSFFEYLKTIKTSSIFGAPANPSYHVSLKDTMQTIFNYLNLMDQTIKILPFDTYPNAENYVLSFLQINANEGEEKICRIDEQKFYYLCRQALYLITFEDEYIDFNINVIQDITHPFEIQKWDEDRFAVIIGERKLFSFKHGSEWAPYSDFLAKQIIFYDGSGNYISTLQLNTFDKDGYRYIPVASSIQKFDRLNRYVIYYHGANISTPRKVERCCFRVYDANTHDVVYSVYLDSYYKHPENYSTTSYYFTKDYYFTFICSTNNFHGNVMIFQLSPLSSGWIYYMQLTLNTAETFKDRIDAIGQYVCFTHYAYAFDVENKNWVLFWEHVEDDNILGRSVRQIDGTINEPCQIISHYSKTTKSLEVKIIDAEGVISTILDSSSLFPSGYYPITGFTYWRTYKNKPNLLGVIAANNILSIGLISNQIYPFVKRPPLDKNETLADTIKELAIAGCCFYYFPDNTKGIFISRAYWDSNKIYTISPSLFEKQYLVTYQAPRRIIVTTGNINITVGEEIKSLSINSNYIPDNDENIVYAYGQVYYNFLASYPFVIEIDTDFLIQYELFDLVQVYSTSEQYQGRIMRSVQEKTRVSFEIRGKKI